eukprot:1031084-Rhodomonas_salina.6
MVAEEGDCFEEEEEEEQAEPKEEEEEEEDKEEEEEEEEEDEDADEEREAPTAREGEETEEGKEEQQRVQAVHPLSSTFGSDVLGPELTGQWPGGGCKRSRVEPRGHRTFRPGSTPCCIQSSDAFAMSCRGLILLVLRAARVGADDGRRLASHRRYQLAQLACDVRA